MKPGTTACAILLLSTLAATGPRAAAHAAGNGAQAMLEQGVAITRERKSLESQQAALLKQKADLDAAGKVLDQQQAALNQEIETNNEAIAQHNGKPGQSQSDCKPGETGASQTQQCNQDAKTLNQTTGSLAAQQAALKQRQADLDAAYQRHGQDAAGWNEREQKTVTRLNTVYQGQNNWMDAANSLIVSDAFQALLTQADAGKRCSGTVPTSDRLTLTQLQKYADAIVGCLGYVAKHPGGTPPG